MRYFDLQHRVSFEETNLVGNVYYVNFLRWQGRCREMFLAEHAPEVLDELRHDLALATVHCSCDYLAELTAFDEVTIRMRLKEVRQNRIRFAFEYLRSADTGGEELVARGEQEIACMRRRGEDLVPTQVPAVLREALRPYEPSG